MNAGHLPTYNHPEIPDRNTSTDANVRLGVQGIEGEWTVSKTPIAWRYAIGLTCGVCGIEATFKGEITEKDDGRTPVGLDMGGWKRFDTPVSRHADPLDQRQETVVCSKACFAELYDRA